MMETRIKELMIKLKEALQKEEIIIVVYNPYREEGIRWDDCKFLKSLFEENKYNSPIFILSGHGGDFVPGFTFPHLINQYVKNYKVYVPSICGSSLCYTIFKASELWIGDKTKITQVDPLFEHNGQLLRAVDFMYGPESDLKTRAREVFFAVRNKLKEIILSSPLFAFKTMSRGEFQHQELVEEYFMKKEGHEKQLSKRELSNLEVKFKEMGAEIDLIANNLIKACQDYTIQQDVRVIFASSSPLKIKSESAEIFGNFICPLK